MWGTDLTVTPTVDEGRASVFIAIDHCTCECVGIHASKTANRFEALEPIRQGIREHFGGFEENIAEGLELRHDHGSQYVSDDFQNEIAFLGVQTSPSFVREPEGNGCAERFIVPSKKTSCGLDTSVPSKTCATHSLSSGQIQPQVDHRTSRLQDARTG